MAHQLQLNPLEAKTKGEVKRLRKAGYIPVSIQHKDMETQHYQQESRSLEEFLRRYGSAALLELSIAPDNRKQRAIVQQVQRDPLTQNLLQVTFQQVRRGDTVKTQLPLVFTGEPEAVRLNDFMIQHLLDSLDIECDPENLPTHITVDVSNMEAGGVLRVSDLPEDTHYKIMTPDDAVLASLISTRHGVEAEAVEAAEEGEPELIGDAAEAAAAATEE